MGKKMRFKISLAMPQAWFHKLRDAKKMETAAGGRVAGGAAAVAQPSPGGLCRNSIAGSYSSPVNHKAIDISYPESTPKRCSPHLRSPLSSRAPPDLHHHAHHQESISPLSGHVEIVADAWPSAHLSGAVPKTKEDDGGRAAISSESYLDNSVLANNAVVSSDFPGFTSARRAESSDPMAPTFDFRELERRLKSLVSEDRRKYYVSPLLSETLPSPNVPDGGAAPLLATAGGDKAPASSSQEQVRMQDCVQKLRPSLAVVYEEECKRSAVVPEGGGCIPIEECGSGDNPPDGSGGSIEESMRPGCSSTITTTTTTTSTTSSSDTLLLHDRGSTNSSSNLWERDLFSGGSDGSEALAQTITCSTSVMDPRVDLQFLANYTSNPSLYLPEPSGQRKHRKPQPGKVRTTHNSPLQPPESDADMELVTIDDGSICTALIVPAGFQRIDDGSDSYDARFQRIDGLQRPQVFSAGETPDRTKADKSSGIIMGSRTAPPSAACRTAPPTPLPSVMTDDHHRRSSHRLSRSNSEPESVLMLRDVLQELANQTPHSASGFASNAHQQITVASAGRTDHLLHCSEDEDGLLEKVAFGWDEERNQSSGSDADRRSAVCLLPPSPDDDDDDDDDDFLNELVLLGYGGRRRSLELRPCFSAAAESGFLYQERAASETEMEVTSNYSKFKQQRKQRRAGGGGSGMMMGAGRGNGAAGGGGQDREDGLRIAPWGDSRSSGAYGWTSYAEDQAAASDYGRSRAVGSAFGERRRRQRRGEGGRSASPPASSAAADRKRAAAYYHNRGGGRVRQSAKSGGGVMDSRAMVKRSFEPRRDFKESMEEMIREKGLWSSNDMVELLQCYLALNSDHFHDLIVKVFTEVWADVVLRRRRLQVQPHIPP